MKKFLTVLLVIAVMFTFSFGSAFAAEPTATEKATALTDAKTLAEKIINNYYDAAMEIVVKADFGYTIADDADKAAAWAAIDVKGGLATYISEKYVAEAAASPVAFPNYASGITTADYAAKVFGLTTGVVDEAAMLADLIQKEMKYEAVYNMYEADRAEILSAFDKVDYSVYSATEKNAEGKTYLEVAEEKIAAAKKEAETTAVYKLEEYNDNSGAALVQNAIPKLNALVAKYVTAQKYAGTPYETGLYTVNGVPTADKVEADKLADAATVAAAKAAIQKLYADYLVTEGADKDFAADYVTIYNYLAEEGIITAADLATQGNIGQYVGGYKAALAKAIADVEDLEAFAAKYAAEKDATGAYVRDAEEVNKLVAKAKLGTYAAAVNVNVAPDKVLTISQAETKIANMSINSEAAELAFAKEVAKANLADAKASLKLDTKFYALEAAKVEAAYEKTLAKIEEATTVAKVKAIDTNAKTLKGSVLNAEEVDAKVSFASGAPKAALDAVKAYVTYANSGKNVLNNEYILATEAEMMDAIEDIYGEAGARTAAEMKAVAIDPAAIAAELTTVGTVAELKAAAEEAIKALPAKVTEADKEAVVAAVEAAADYAEVGTLSSTLAAKLETAKAALKTDMVKNFAIAVAQTDKTDLEAMKALQAEFDAANELVADGVVAGPKFDDSKVVAAIKAIKEAQLKAVIKAINAIPVNVTEADKAVVEAARAAYDAYVAEWTAYEDFDNCYAAGEIDNFRELALAEAALGLNAEDPAYSVESLKIKARTDKAKKGSITVRWTVVDGDDSAVEGYEIWKSTKHSSGYKKMVTKSADSDWYKNTKGLKKGTRYYYKVRAIAYTEDGVKVKSDFSNKARRIAK